MASTLFQAYRSCKPISNEKEWLPHSGKTADEVRTSVMGDHRLGFSWPSIYIAEVTEVQS